MKRASTSRKSRTDLTRLRKLSDAAIVRDRDAPAWTPAMFARAVARQGLKPVPKKVLLSLRVDADVVDWFRAGPLHMNAADILLCAGGALLMLQMLREK